jgi:hypothetical protein
MNRGIIPFMLVALAAGTTHAAEPPKSQAPVGLDKAEGDGVLVDDWLFQAEGKPLGQRAIQEIGWAREMAERIKMLPGAPDLSAELAELDRLARPVAGPASVQPPAVQPQVKLPDGLVGRWVRGDLGGTNYLNVGAKAATVVAGNYTLCAWIRTTSDRADVIGNGVTTGHFLLMLQGVTRACHGPAALCGKTRVNDGMWHHVAQVVDGGTLSLVVDGKPDGAMQFQGAQTSDKPPAAVQPVADDTPAPDAIETIDGGTPVPAKGGKAAGARNIPETKAAPPSPATVGSRGGPASTFEGELDEVCVFDRALSVEQIGAAFPAGRAPKSPDAERYQAVRSVKRRIMFKHPAIDFRGILYIDQSLPSVSRSYHQTAHRLGWNMVGGGRLLVKDGFDPAAEPRSLVSGPGAFWRSDLSFDTRKVLFCMKAEKSPTFNLYEVGMDGSGLRQLTRGDHDDLDPIYLPDGHIMFSTTRAKSFIRCAPEMNYAYVLARCDADGRNIYVISRNNECDWLPSLLEDGRVIYSRWEYSDKPLWRVQSLWTINQDGTGEAVVWGNQSVWPDHLAQPRQVPGTSRIMFAGVGHHNWFDGSIGMIDPDMGREYPDGIWRVTVEKPWGEVGPGPSDMPLTADYHTAGKFDWYQTPWPLCKDVFMVSARRSGSRSLDLYLMDIHGNRELIARAQQNVFHAMPVRARSFPAHPDRVAWPGTGADHKPSRQGVLYSPDVYSGVPGLTRGTVKSLRVIQQDHKTYSTQSRDKTGAHGPAVSAVLVDSVKRILGTVPVREDGSVSFELPPGQAVYFQLLDERGYAVHTMRSFTGVMPGETRGCLGCHELHSAAPSIKASSAYHAAPSTITPPPWGTKVTVGYERFVQSVLDKHCVKCHQGDGEGRRKLDLTPENVDDVMDPTKRDSERRQKLDLTLRKGIGPFKQPYLDLIGTSWLHKGKDLAATIRVEDNNNAYKNPNWYATLPPLTRLSPRSRLIELVTSGKHHDVRITGQELQQLIAWVDCNGPFMGEDEVRAIPDRGGPFLTKSAPLIDRFNLPQDTSIPERDEVRK